MKSGVQVGGTQGAASAASNEPVKYSDFLHLPHGLDGYFDYDQALKAAQAQDKPLFIDFTGHVRWNRVFGLILACLKC